MKTCRYSQALFTGVRTLGLGLALGLCLAPRGMADVPELPPHWGRIYPYLESGNLTLRDIEGKGGPPLHLLRPTPLSHEPPDCVLPDSLTRPTDPDTLNALHYEIRLLEINEDEETLTGEATVTLEALTPLDAIDLDFSQLEATGIQVLDGDVWRFAPYNHDEDRLHILLPQTASAYSTVKVRVEYSGSPSCFALILNAGMVFDHRGAHTFSQPWYARHWFPCIDVPWDKATATLEVHLQEGQNAVATGVLVTEEDRGPNGRVKTWSMSDPVATYLIGVYLGDFVAIEETVTDLGIPVRGYTYPGLLALTDTVFAPTVDMLNFFSQVYPYPFPSYANTVAPFPGGMEHQTNSMIGELFLGRIFLESLLAHEVAHQWWGDLVTPASWNDIWLNEGPATYFDLMYWEHTYGFEAFQKRVTEIENSFFWGDSVIARQENERYPLLGMPADRWSGFEVYLKGGMVVHMLRSLCRFHYMPPGPFDADALRDARAAGDDLFLLTLGRYAETHAYGNASSQDLQHAFEAALFEDLDWFFQPWLREAGYPELRYETSGVDGSPFLRTHLEQIQEDSPLVEMPLLLEYQSSADTLYERVLLKKERISTHVTYLEGAWSVRVDPLNWLLGTSKAAPVEAPVLPGTGTASPNPSETGFLLAYDLEQPGNGSGLLHIYDSRGRLSFERTVPVGGSLVEVYWDGHNSLGARLPAGIYFARFTAESGRVYSTRLVLLP